MERMKTMQARWFAQREAALAGEREGGGEGDGATQPPTAAAVSVASAAERPCAHRDRGSTREGYARSATEQARQLVEQAVREEMQLAAAAGRDSAPAERAPGQSARGSGAARSEDLLRGCTAVRCADEADTRRMLEEIAAEEEALGVWCLQDMLLSVPDSGCAAPASAQRHVAEDDEDLAEMDVMNDFLTAVEFQMHELDHMDGV